MSAETQRQYREVLAHFRRHIYDLHVMREQITQLARAIARADAQAFRNQYPEERAKATVAAGSPVAGAAVQP
ncbi:MAG: hypothetical protein EXR07_05360 [Acetobacteraceae bacterium]|nr:hypothetical protein [Acetobacteraceae bacterium]